MNDYLNFQTDLSNPNVAAAFDDFTYWSSMFGQMLFRHVPLVHDASVLDVGCGTGFPLIELADRLGPNAMVRGIDSWPEAIERTKLKLQVRENPNVPVTLGDATQMPYENDSFDLIVSNLGVNNFDHPEQVMAECHRVCKDQGRMALTTNLVGHMSEFYEVFEQALIDTDNADRLEDLNCHQAHRATSEGLHQLFSDAGFDVTQFHPETFTLRYADGTAFLNAYLSRIGFLDGWRSVLGSRELQVLIFNEIETRMNRIADAQGEIRLTIPAAYIEGTKRSSV